MKTMCHPSYQYNGFVATHPLVHMMYACARTSCAQVQELPQSHCGDSRVDTLFSCLHIRYAYLAFVRFEHSVCRGSLMTTYLYIFIYKYICNHKNNVLSHFSPQ